MAVSDDGTGGGGIAFLEGAAAAAAGGGTFSDSLPPPCLSLAAAAAAAKPLTPFWVCRPGVCLFLDRIPPPWLPPWPPPAAGRGTYCKKERGISRGYQSRTAKPQKTTVSTRRINGTLENVKRLSRLPDRQTYWKRERDSAPNGRLI